MTLREYQNQFAKMLPGLLEKAFTLGFDVSIGEVYRSPEEAIRLSRVGKGSMNSLHCVRLAIDLNLFKGGVYQTSSEAHRELGEWWESQGGAWGGRFVDAKGNPKPDGNHYSLEYQGRK